MTIYGLRNGLDPYKYGDKEYIQCVGEPTHWAMWVKNEPRCVIFSGPDHFLYFLAKLRERQWESL